MDDFVAFARSSFEARAIDNGHGSTVVAQEALPLESCDRNGNARSADPQHLRQELMGNGEFAAA